MKVSHRTLKCLIWNWTFYVSLADVPTSCHSNNDHFNKHSFISHHTHTPYLGATLAPSMPCTFPEGHPEMKALIHSKAGIQSWLMVCHRHADTCLKRAGVLGWAARAHKHTNPPGFLRSEGFQQTVWMLRWRWSAWLIWGSGFFMVYTWCVFAGCVTSLLIWCLFNELLKQCILKKLNNYYLLLYYRGNQLKIIEVRIKKINNQ